MDRHSIDEGKLEPVSSGLPIDTEPRAPQILSEDVQAQSPDESKESTPTIDPSEAKDVDTSVVEKNAHADAIAKEDFSVFTVGQKKAIIVAGSFLGLFSPMTGTMYYPALSSIAADLHVSSSKINITVTTYLIIQGLAPMIIAGFSDTAGRRPAYFLCLTIYIVANLALALQNNYIALLILRMLQSAGSSGTIALAQGLVGDLVVSAERGKYVAWASLGTILGPTLSPVLGGVISEYAGWHWIFWFLLILSIVSFIPMALFLPETCRNIVGDGSIPPPWTSKNLTDTLRHRHRARSNLPLDEAKLTALRKNHRLTIPNPIGTLRVLADLESALILLSLGLSLALFYAVSTGASQNFHQVYGFDDLHVSLMFLPMGAGMIVAAFATGKVVDWNYRRHAHRLNFPIERNRQADLTHFPLELARLQIGVPLLLLGALSTLLYGWILHLSLSHSPSRSTPHQPHNIQTHPITLAAPILLLFVMGLGLTGGFQTLNILIIDIYPGKAATAAAANNVTRCLLGAGASAVIGPLGGEVGWGWAYTVLVAVFVGGSGGLVWVAVRGMRWRGRKKERAERREREGEGGRGEGEEGSEKG